MLKILVKIPTNIFDKIFEILEKLDLIGSISESVNLLPMVDSDRCFVCGTYIIDTVNYSPNKLFSCSDRIPLIFLHLTSAIPSRISFDLFLSTGEFPGL